MCGRSGRELTVLDTEHDVIIAAIVEVRLLHQGRFCGGRSGRAETRSVPVMYFLCVSETVNTMSY